jgi:signal transduction histidine kinase
LEWLAGSLDAKCGLMVEHSIAEDAEPQSEDIRLLLFHSCQELLLNVAKHAGTSSARLSLRRVGEAIFLTVEDRGRGMERGKESSDEGIGLPRIRRAVEQVQGTLTVRTGPSEGTTVEVRVPARAFLERR